ncbi:MAG: hypothetical protein IJ769_01005 [Clostridia bacterium]|nr:hypothetical protein [Clostridia bacterium]
MTQAKKGLRLVRVPDAFLPTALAISSVLRRSSNTALELYIAWFAVACLSLFASRGIRIAFARQPAIRHVRGSVKCALLITLAGGGVLVAALLLLGPERNPDPLPLVVAGCLLNIEHIFYEYMYAIGDGHSAALSRGLTALFTLVGLMLYETSQAFYPLRLVGMTALSALVSLIIGLVMGDGSKGRLDSTVIRCAPRAALQTAFYPAAAVALVLICDFNHYSFAFFVGLALYELCKTPFRRSPLEARPYNKSLLIICSAAGLLCFASALIPFTASGVENLWTWLWRALPATCAMLIAAALCAFALFGNIQGKAE